MSRSNILSPRIEAHLQAKLEEMFGPARGAAGGQTVALHRMRVATRRLRVGLRYFSALFPSGDHRQIQKHLRRATRSLGKIRSVDVQLQLLRQSRQYLPAATTTVQRKLTGELLADRHRHVTELQELFQTFATSQFEAHIRKLVLQPRPLDDQRVLADAREYLAKLRRQMRRRFKDCRRDERSGPPFHKLRLAAKRYRYALETSTAVLQISAAAQIQAIKKMQAHLGASHDLEELLEFLQACRRKWQKADNPLAGRLANVLTFFQGEHEVAFAAAQDNLREDHGWHKKVKIRLARDDDRALSR